MKNTPGLIGSAILICICGCHSGSENLLFNGGAEIPRYDTVPNGWQNIAGKWTSFEGDSLRHDGGYADSGRYYFFGGMGDICVLQQDVDVVKHAKDIDGGGQRFIFSGYERSLNQGPFSDQGMFKLQCFDVTKSRVLFSDFTDTLMSIDKWQHIADTFLVPKLTRFVRVQLVAIRHVGADNDGYFDELSLSALPSRNYMLIFLIVLAVALIIGVVIVYHQKKHSPGLT